MLQWYELTSRMKDFYDIAYLAHTFDFKGNRLQEAVSRTIKTRGTIFESDSLDKISQLVNEPVIQVRWRHFQKIMPENKLSFPEIMQTINIFLRPVCEALISGTELKTNWKAEIQDWVC